MTLATRKVPESRISSKHDKVRSSDLTAEKVYPTLIRNVDQKQKVTIEKKKRQWQDLASRRKIKSEKR